MPHTEFVIDATGHLVEAPAFAPAPANETTEAACRPQFEITFEDGRTTIVEGADAFQPEGPLVTFFATGSTRGEIDSWSRRVATYRSSLIISVEQLPPVTEGGNAADPDPRRLVAV